MPTTITEVMTVTQAIDDAIKFYTDRNPKSEALFQSAQEFLPGGNTRSLLYAAPFPISMRKGDGHQLIDEDDHV